jgi:hypothetical protein
MTDQITNHTEQALKRQVSQWKGLTQDDGNISVYSDRMQKLENILFELLDGRNLNDAVGVQLDLIGATYGEFGARSNRDDDTYRTFLKTLPAKLRQAGQHEVLVQALINLSGAMRVETEYSWPRAMSLYIILDDVDSLPNEDEINAEMQSIRAYGIRLDIGIKQPTESFVFSEFDNGDVPLNSGFATLDDGSDGGAFIKLIG